MVYLSLSLSFCAIPSLSNVSKAKCLGFDSIHSGMISCRRMHVCGALVWLIIRVRDDRRCFDWANKQKSESFGDIRHFLIRLISIIAVSISKHWQAHKSA